MSYTVDGIAPQPYTHGVRVGMDKQNAETGGADSIDEVALLDIKVFEPKEGAECHQNSKKLVTIVHVFKHVLVHGPHDVLELNPYRVLDI